MLFSGFGMLFSEATFQKVFKVDMLFFSEGQYSFGVR
jgi:hypothetical protein